MRELIALLVGLKDPARVEGQACVERGVWVEERAWVEGRLRACSES